MVMCHLFCQIVLVSQRIRGSTCKGYFNKMKTFGKLITLRTGAAAANHLQVSGQLPMMPKVPTDPGIVNAFFGDLCEKRGTSHPVFGKTHKKTLGNNGHPSAQTISGFKSALVWWHLENGVAINEALNGKLDMLIKGYKRRVGDWKQIGEMSALEGVQPLSFAGYEL